MTTPELVPKPHHGNLQTKAPESFPDNAEAAGDARKAIETQTGVPVIPSKNAARRNQVVTDLCEGAIKEAVRRTSHDDQ